MKQFGSVLLASLVLTLPLVAQQIPVPSDIGYEGGDSTNRIVLTWESIPTKLYDVLATPALGRQPWQALTPAPLYASNNLVRFRDTNTLPARFYQVVKLDTDPPEVWRLNPASNAIAVGRQSPLKAYLRDETAIDPTSIALTVGTNPPVTLADARLAFTNGVLTYTPGTNEFLGDNEQTVTNCLILADTLGHWATNTWVFQLELTPILADNVVLIGGASGFAAQSARSAGLTLLSTNGDTFVFRYEGDSSGLTNGHVVVSTDANFPYKRAVLSLTDDPLNHTVSLVTTPASLAQCLWQGSIRLVGDFAGSGGEGSGRAKAAGGIGAVIPLGGTVLYDNSTIRVEITSGQITFAPDYMIAGDFKNDRLVSFDCDVYGALGLDMTLQGSFQTSGDWDGSKPLITPRRTLKLLGFVGPVPVWVEAVLEFNVGFEAHAEAQGSVAWGFESSRTLTYGVELRNGQWSHSEQQTSRYQPFPPGWQINGAATVKGYVQPKLTVYLESLAGPSSDLKPYLEIDGNACVQPGQVGVDLSVYAGLSSTLAMEVRGWDPAWGKLPSWDLFNLRGLLWHTNLSTAIGPPPQTIPNMVWIPCGTFTMGSPASEPNRSSNEGPQTRVTISRGFWMGKYEVTQGEYLAVMGNNPSWFNGPRLTWDFISGSDQITNDWGNDLSRPVEYVTWNDTVAYCQLLSAREQAAGRLPAGYEYRLPTEAQWEYACRAGTTTPFHYGNTLHPGMANFYGYGRTMSTKPVGSYAPNAWGLYDMHGNVLEWCQDWMSLPSSLPGGSVTDPQGPASSPDYLRVLRGGIIGADACRSAYRYGYYPSGRNSFWGFRVVLVSVP